MAETIFRDPEEDTVGEELVEVDVVVEVGDVVLERLESEDGPAVALSAGAAGELELLVLFFVPIPTPTPTATAMIINKAARKTAAHSSFGGRPHVRLFSFSARMGAEFSGWKNVCGSFDV